MNRHNETLSIAQGEFSQALLDPEHAVPSDLKKIGSEPSANPTSKRFDVYRNNVVATMIDALGDSFPTTRKLVGDEYFSALARAYIDFETPTSPLLFRYGDSFGDFLNGFAPVQASVPYLGDVARLEFARLQAYHAEDIHPINISELSGIAPETVATVCLVAHPSLALITSGHPIVSLYGASNDLLPGDQIDLNCAETALVVRPGFQVNTVLLPHDGAVFLEALTKGSNLGRAAEIATGAFEAFDLSTHLAGLFDAGCFISIELSD